MISEYVIPVVLIGVAIVALVMFVKWRKGKKDRDDSWKLNTVTRANRIRRDENVVMLTTPNGAKVYYESGLVPNEALHMAIDRGVAKTIEKAICEGYDAKLSDFDLNVVVLEGENDSQGDPAFRVPIWPGDPYYGGPFDKGSPDGSDVHYILAAAETISGGANAPDTFVIAYHAPSQASHAELCSEFEMEHLAYLHYNWARFQETQYHLTGGHPIMKDCPGFRSVGLIGSEIEKANDVAFVCSVTI